MQQVLTNSWTCQCVWPKNDRFMPPQKKSSPWQILARIFLPSNFFPQFWRRLERNKKSFFGSLVKAFIPKPQSDAFIFSKLCHIDRRNTGPTKIGEKGQLEFSREGYFYSYKLCHIAEETRVRRKLVQKVNFNYQERDIFCHNWHIDRKYRKYGLKYMTRV